MLRTARIVLLACGLTRGVTLAVLNTKLVDLGTDEVWNRLGVFRCIGRHVVTANAVEHQCFLEDSTRGCQKRC